MKKLSGSKTEENLRIAFAGESEARNKYTYYASKAKKEGYEQIAAFFEDTAFNEKEHGKIWFKLLNDGIKSTRENLKDAMEAENYEHVSMYPEFARVAHEEGYEHIANLFASVADIERTHKERFEALMNNMDQDKVFHRKEKEQWFCRNCGHIEVGRDAPIVCPVCSHPQAFYEIHKINY